MLIVQKLRKTYPWVNEKQDQLREITLGGGTYMNEELEGGSLWTLLRYFEGH